MTNCFFPFRMAVLALTLLLVSGSTVFARDVAAVITQIVGALYAKDMGNPQFRVAKKGEFVYEGTKLKTGKGDRAAISFVNGIEVKIDEETTYVVLTGKPADRGKGHKTLLEKGRMWFKSFRKKVKFGVRTPVAAISIRGTEGDVGFQNSMRAVCYEGAFQVTAYQSTGDDDDLPLDDPGDEAGGVLVSAGQVAIVSPGKPPELRSTDQRDTWQDRVDVDREGKIVLAVGTSQVPKETSVKVTLKAVDSSGDTDPNFNDEVLVFADRDDALFSIDGQFGWNQRMRVRLVNGEGSCWVKASRSGYVNVNAHIPGFDGIAARFMVTKPSKRELEVEIEGEDGERKKIRLEFGR